MSACIIDDERCPRCKAATLVTRPGAIEGGARYRYCSYVSCSWGIDADEPYVPSPAAGSGDLPSPSPWGSDKGGER